MTCSKISSTQSQQGPLQETLLGRKVTDSNQKQISLVGIVQGVYLYKTIINGKITDTGKIIKME